MKNYLSEMLYALTSAYSRKDYVNYQQGRLPETNIGKLFALLAWGLDIVHEQAETVRQWDNLDNARGSVLDRYGANFGVARGSASDTLYRLLINTKMIAQISGGDDTSIIRAAAELFDMDYSDLYLEDVFPAKKHLHVSWELIPQDRLGLIEQFGYIIKRTMAAGIGFIMVMHMPVFVFVEKPEFLSFPRLEFRTWFSNFAVVLLNGRRKLDGGSWTLHQHLPGLPFPRLAMRFLPFQNRERLTQIFALYGRWHAHPERFRFPMLTLVSAFRETGQFVFPTFHALTRFAESESVAIPSLCFRGFSGRQTFRTGIPNLTLGSKFREREQLVFPSFHAAAPFVEREAVSIPSILFRGFYGRQMLGAAVPALTLGSLFREAERLTFPAFGITAAFLEKRETFSALSVQFRAFRARETETLQHRTFRLSSSVFHTGNTAALPRFYWNGRGKHQYQTMAGTLVQNPAWVLNGKHKLDGTRRLNGAKHNVLQEVL